MSTPTRTPTSPTAAGFAEQAAPFIGAADAAEVMLGSVAEQHALRRFADAVCSHYGDRVTAIVLFGIRARGDAHPGSDADVAVVLDDGEWSSWRERRVLAGFGYDVLLGDGLDIEAWPIRASEWTATRCASKFVEHARRVGRSFGEIA